MGVVLATPQLAEPSGSVVVGERIFSRSISPAICALPVWTAREVPLSNSQICVSIVIPCLNGAATLGAAIETCLAQGLDDMEVVVVDDGSTDRSLEIARSFEPKVRVFTGPNRGVSAARNRGISESIGEWLVFLDADDLLAPGTMSARLAFAAANPADVVICDWREFSGSDANAANGRLRSVDMRDLSADAEIACATHAWATTCALMYRRSIVERIGGFRGDLPVIQDARFLFDAAYAGARFAHFSHVGAYYRVLPDSLSRRNPSKFWCDVLTNAKQIEALWRARSALSPAQGNALQSIYNTAARNLFLAQDRIFLDAIAALRASGLPVGLRNRAAEIVSHALGQAAAVKLAGGWTRLRHIFHRPQAREESLTS